MLRSKRIALWALALSSLASSAHASFLDTDFWCRTYGCAVVHDGVNFDADEGFMFGITQDGSTINASIFDDGDGYLDAGDVFGAFTLNPNTDILLDGPGRAYSRSFFISSRNTRFSLRALASITNASGDFSNTIQLGDIKLTPTITATGNDGGFQFGSRANTSNIQIVSGVDDLGDLTGIPTQVMNFGRRQGIRQRNGDIDTQTIRLDFLYEMPDYDMSMGTGSLNVDVQFDFYREN